MDIKQLKELQQIFIESKDWEEVSKIQYQIDNLPEENEPKGLETWFRVALTEHAFRMLDTWATEILWMGEKLKNIEKEKKNV